MPSLAITARRTGRDDLEPEVSVGECKAKNRSPTPTASLGQHTLTTTESQPPLPASSGNTSQARASHVPC